MLCAENNNGYKAHSRAHCRLIVRCCEDTSYSDMMERVYLLRIRQLLSTDLEVQRLRIELTFYGTKS
jgi:hypothetical protein